MLEPITTVEALPAEPIQQTQSGVIIASWAGIVFMALGLFGVAVKPETQRAWVELVTQAAPLVGGLVAFCVTWWRRRRTIAPIVGAPNDPQVIAKKQEMEQVRAILHGE